MLTKIALTVLVIGIAVLVLFRVRRPAGRVGAAPRPLALVQCPDCGTHHLPGRPCGCGGGGRG